jgi:hypothetical protein
MLITATTVLEAAHRINDAHDFALDASRRVDRARLDYLKARDYRCEVEAELDAAFDAAPAYHEHRADGAKITTYVSAHSAAPAYYVTVNERPLPCGCYEGQACAACAAVR